MGKIHDHIDEQLKGWIKTQPVFFVATAPLAADGHVNASPKGGDSFRVLTHSRVAYQDYTGSGAETIAHLRENGRIVVMFCAFEGPRRIVRLHGRGSVLEPSHPEFSGLARHFPKNPGTRAIIRIDVQRIADSCGYGVPLFDYRGQRDTLDRWAQKKGTAGLEAYREEKNRRSIDGLPALEDPAD